MKITNQSGMTLVELMVVVAIIGILAAVGIPIYQNNVRVAKNIDAQNNLRSIFMMQKNYFADNSCYFVTSGPANNTSMINQYLMGSTTPASGPIPTTNNDFYYYILPGPVGAVGSCSGNNSNDYIAYAVSASMANTASPIIYSINQANIKTGF